MATIVLDKDKVVELIRSYRPDATQIKVAGGNSGVLIRCPFHNDSKPSYTFTIETGRGGCFSCRNKSSFEELIASFEQISLADATKKAAHCYKSVKQKAASKVTAIDISHAQVQEWQKDLVSNLKLTALLKKWGWTNEVVDRFKLGSSDGRLVIPMFEKEDLIGLKFYTPGGQIKYQNHPGSVQCCWPLENLGNNVVYLVEGEKDCLTMISAGFNAVTFTGGAGSVATAYIRFFAGKTVYIIYDIDEAGRKGAVKVANSLGFAARKTHIVELPLDGVPKGDLTDAYEKDPENFVDYINNLCAHTDEYTAPSIRSRVVIPSDVYKTYLEDIVRVKMFYKRVNIKVRVVNRALHETTIVPKDVVITCNKDYKDGVCGTCPAYFAVEGLTLHIKPEYPELMSMVGNNVKVQRSAIQNMSGVIEGCPKFKIEQCSHQALYPLVMIPAIEADKTKHDYSMVTAWALDVPAKENIDYDIEGVVLANPETQKLELICYRMTEDEASIDSFELTEELVERLKVFQCNPPPLPQLQTS